MSRLLPCVCALLPLLLGACAADSYTRRTATLEVPDAEAYRVRYAPLEGCLLRQEYPQAYAVERSRYALALEVRPADGDASPVIDIRLSGSGAPHARFPDAQPAPVGEETELYRRYRLPVDTLVGDRLTVEVLRDGTLLGTERYAVEHQRCRVVGF